jgi:molybdopterin molybdotransferase
MSQFLRLIPPDEARAQLLLQLPGPFDSDRPGIDENFEIIDTLLSLGRVTVEDIVAPHSLPEFPRSSVDGYAVRASDTFGSTDSMPSYLNLIGEVPMGKTSSYDLESGQCVLIHTGGMLPKGADAVVMLEYTQEIKNKNVGGQGYADNIISPEQVSSVFINEIEILRAVADGENVILVGEDVKEGSIVLTKGRKIRPPEIGGLCALGILSLRVAIRPRIGIISSGDEIVNPDRQTQLGQVRDVNSYTLSALVTKSGGVPILYGVVPDQKMRLREISMKALMECNMVVITAGSSASSRDMTAEVINSLGDPGVIVHGINTRPGKPTILGVCSGKAVIGLPGNPVSALVNGYLFVKPVIEKLLGLPYDILTGSIGYPSVLARLTVNLPSQAGREDWWPVKLIPDPIPGDIFSDKNRRSELMDNWQAVPIFGKSNLIFTLVAADGLLRISSEVTGLSEGERVEVILL